MANVISFENLEQHLKDVGRYQSTVLTSLPADPLHVGHVRLLQDSADIIRHRITGVGRLIVIVNDDDFLMRKKGYVFMPLAERMEIVAAIAGVDFVAPWSSESQFVDEAIRRLRPRFFTKGGDRSSPAQVASCEIAACEEVGCQILYGIGGSEKVQSSSQLVRKCQINAGQEARRVSGSSGHFQDS